MLLARHVLPVARIRALIGEETEILRSADGGLGHEAMRLTGIDAFEHRNIVGAVFDRVGNPMQQLLAHRRGHVAPRFECQCGCGGGAVDILRVAARDARQHGAINRRFGLEAGAGNRGRALAVDHMPDAVGL